MGIPEDVDSRIEQLAHGSDLGLVAEVLSRHSQDILSSWLEAARKQPFHAMRPEGAVADHIPALFTALVAVLRRTSARWLDTPPPLGDPAVLDAAQRHARVRFEQGLHPDDVLTEFRLLRQEIGSALRKHLADAAPASDVMGAELVVHDALDAAIGLALAALSSHVTEVRDEFLATTTHDVMQPLSTVKGAIQIARRALVTPAPDLERIDQVLDRAESEVQRLTALLQALGDASRVTLGSLDFTLEQVDLVRVVRAAIHRLDADVAEKVRVTVRGPDVTGNWDALALDRVISNLLSNAIKYSPEGSAIEVIVEAEPDAARLAVRDHGMGLEPDEIAGLFERYGRSRGAVERGIPGIGLGLYLSRGIVRALGGRIWAESHGRDRGTTMHVWLPRSWSGMRVD